MADDFDCDFDGFDDDAWLYVDDEFDLADELAEGQVPDPGYAGNNAEIDFETYDYDFHHYWDDLEYGDDAYWDVGLSGANDNKAGVKRKRSAAKKESLVDKRRKVGREEYKVYTREQDPLIFCSRADRTRPRERNPLQRNATKFSLLPDWRKRFANVDGLLSSREMPLDMRRAAETEMVDTSLDTGPTQTSDEEGDEEWEDDEDNDDDEGAAALDLDMLKQVLKQKLGEAGLDGMDEDAFMQTIAKMLSSGDDADDAAGELASNLLGKLNSGAAAGQGEALSGWLSQQGVSMPAEDDEDDASSVATVELPAGRMQSATRPQPSTSSGTAPAQQPDAFSSSDLSTVRKHAVDSTAAEGRPVKRHKKVTFDVPLSATASDPAASDPDAAEPLLTSEDPLMSAPTIDTQVTLHSRGTEQTDPKISIKAAPSQDKPKIMSRKRKANITSENTGTEKENLEGNLEAKPPPEKKKRASTRSAVSRSEMTKPGALDETISQKPPTNVTRTTRSKSVKKE